MRVSAPAEMLYGILRALGKRLGKPRGYERLVRLVCSPEKIRWQPAEIVALRDEPLIVADPRTLLGWNLLLFGNYEPELRVCFRNFLRPGFVAADVGANIGWHTLLMAQCVREQGRVIAFEPNPWVRKQLAFHVSFNRFPQIEVLPYALSDRPGHVRFHAPPADDVHAGGGCLMAASAPDMRDCIEVEATPFDALLEPLALERLDLIKMDIEGFELPALRGCERAIAKFRPHIVFEFDKNFISRCNGTWEHMRDLFQGHCYKLFIATRWGLEAARDEGWPDSANFWAVPLPKTEI